MEAALTAAGNSYFENVAGVHKALERGALLDPTGLTNATNLTLYYVEDGTSLSQISADVLPNLLTNRVANKVISHLPVANINPTDQIGFARKAKNATRDAERAARRTRTILTSAEAKAFAMENGWIKMNERSPNGEAIYQREKGVKPRYVSYDNTHHNGCVWKGANDKKILTQGAREGSYDKFMNRVKK